ncbi:MAG: diguanylate cyclase [Pseudomonadota bacterium]
MHNDTSFHGPELFDGADDAGRDINPTCLSQIVAWRADRDGAMRFLAKGWQRLTGQARASGLGTGWFDCVVQADIAVMQTAFREAGGAFRARFRLRDGASGSEWIWLDAEADEDGFTGVCVAGADPRDDTSLDEHRLIDVLAHTALAALALDVDGRVRFANATLQSMLGRTAEELQDRNFFDAFCPPGSPAPAFPLQPDGVHGADLPLDFETVILGRGNLRTLVSWHCIVLRSRAGQIRGLVLVGENITLKRQLEQRFILSHKVFETAEMAMLITDARSRIIAINSAFTRLTGYTAEETLGQNPRLLKSHRHDGQFYQRMWHAIAQTGHWQGEVWDQCKDGRHYPKFLSISTIHDQHGVVSNYHGIFYDISERKAIEDKLDHLAHYDALTGLPNRVLLRLRLDQAMSTAARSGRKVALLYLDLDHFKEVNDSCGHDVGDMMLCEVALRLGECVRGDDTVARLGGDEFVVLLAGILDAEAVSIVAGKLLEAIAAPFLLDGRPFKMSTSVGISMYPDDHQTLDTLLKSADQAMYHAKADGRARFRYYDQVAH